MACEECGAGETAVELTPRGYEISSRATAMRVQLHRSWCSRHGTPGTGTCVSEHDEDTKPGHQFNFDELELDDEGFPF